MGRTPREGRERSESGLATLNFLWSWCSSGLLLQVKTRRSLNDDVARDNNNASPDAPTLPRPSVCSSPIRPTASISFALEECTNPIPPTSVYLISVKGTSTPGHPT